MNITVKIADITTLEVDTIVNAANSALCQGGGVDGAIHVAAGHQLAAYIKEQLPFGCPTGLVRRTPGFNLPAKWIFHTVGPDMREYDLRLGTDLLISCYRECMERVIDERVTSIAFPSISTGVYEFDKILAADVVANIMYGFHFYTDMDVIFACFSQEDADILQTAFDNIGLETR